MKIPAELVIEYQLANTIRKGRIGESNDKYGFFTFSNLKDEKIKQTKPIAWH